MKTRFASMLTVMLLSASAPLAPAQEPQLVNGIVARVNNDIITLVDYKNAEEDFREELARQMQAAGKSAAEIESEFNRLQPSILDLLIDDLLIEQKARELSIDVEAEVNQHLREMAEQNGFRDLISFENALRQQGYNPEDLRTNIRKRYLQDYVMQREVMQPIYFNLTEKEKRDFYEKNKERFTKPGSVELSEIFMPLDGHTATDVEDRAKRLVAELRAGVDFVESVLRHSPMTRGTRAQNGRIGAFQLGSNELRPEIAAAIADLDTGQITEPIRLQDGFQIIRVDKRTLPDLRPYEDPEVQNAVGRIITMERVEPARKKFLEKLRSESYIRVNEIDTSR